MLRKLLDSKTNFSKSFNQALRIFTLGVIVISTLAYFSFKKDFAKKVQKQTMIDSVKLVNNLDSVLFYSENITSIIAKNLVREGVKDNKKVAEILKDAIPKINYEKFNIFTVTLFNFLDSDGNLTVTSSTGILPKPIKVLKEKRSWIHDAKLKPWKLHFSKNDFGLVSKEPILPVGFGISDQNNRFLGIVSFGINIDKLKNILETPLDNKLTNFAILSDNGSLILSSDNFEKDLLPELEKVVSSNLLQGNNAQNINIKISRRDFFYTKITNYPKLIMVVGYNHKIFRQEFLSSIYKIFTYFLYFSLFSLILFFLIKKRLVDPVASLARLARKLSNNNANFYLPDSNIEEIKCLSRPIEKLQQEMVKKEELKVLKTKNNKNKKDFLSSISYEFSNITNSIIGVSQFIKSDINLKLKSQNQQFLAETIKEYQDFLDDVKNLSEEILLLAQDIVDINQLDYGIFEIEKFESINLEALSLRCVKLLRTHAIKNQKTLVINFVKSDDCNFIISNLSTKLTKQALVNAIRSAIKYAKNNSKIFITLEAIENEVSEILRDALLKQIRLNNKLEKDHRNSLIKIVEKSRPRANILIKISTLDFEEQKNLCEILENNAIDQNIDLDKKNMLIAKNLIELQGGTIEIKDIGNLNVEIKITF